MGAPSREDFLAFHEALAKALKEEMKARGRISPRLWMAKPEGEGLSALRSEDLAPTIAQGRHMVPAAVGKAFAEGYGLVAVVFEAWASILDKAALFPNGLSPLARITREGKLDSVSCAIHSRDRQAMAIHPILGSGRRRALQEGPLHIDGVTLGGEMASHGPTMH